MAREYTVGFRLDVCGERFRGAAAAAIRQEQALAQVEARRRSTGAQHGNAAGLGAALGIIRP